MHAKTESKIQALAKSAGIKPAPYRTLFLTLLYDAARLSGLAGEHLDGYMARNIRLSEEQLRAMCVAENLAYPNEYADGGLVFTELPELDAFNKKIAGMKSPRLMVRLGYVYLYDDGYFASKMSVYRSANPRVTGDRSAYDMAAKLQLLIRAKFPEL